MGFLDSLKNFGSKVASGIDTVLGQGIVPSVQNLFNYGSLTKPQTTSTPFPTVEIKTDKYGVIPTGEISAPQTQLRQIGGNTGNPVSQGLLGVNSPVQIQGYNVRSGITTPSVPQLTPDQTQNAQRSLGSAGSPAPLASAQPQTKQVFQNGQLVTVPFSFNPVSPSRPSSTAPSTIGGFGGGQFDGGGAFGSGGGFPNVASPISLGGQANADNGGTQDPNVRKRLLGTNIVPTSQTSTPPFLGLNLNTPAFQVPNAKTSQIPANKVLTNPEQTSKLIPANAGVRESAQDFSSRLNSMAEQKSIENQQKNPLPDSPLLDINSIADPNNPEELKTLDDFVKKNLEYFEQAQKALGIDVKLQELAKVEADLRSWQETFDQAESDIKGNPDFPRALANRRLQLLGEQKTKVIKNFESQIDLLKYDIDTRKDALRERLGLVQSAEQQYLTEQQRRRDDTRSQIGQFISSGAIANFNDAQLVQIAATGIYGIDALKAMRDAVKSQNQFKIDTATTKLDQSEQRLALYAQSIQQSIQNAGLRNELTFLKTQQLLQGSYTDSNGNPVILPEKAKEGLLKIQGVQDNADAIAQKVTELGPDVFGPSARSRGVILGILQKVGLAPQITQYEAMRQALIAPLARAISGEVGVLTDRDIGRAEGLLPKIGDSQEEVQRKLETLYTQIGNRKSAILGQYGAAGSTQSGGGGGSNVNLSDLDFKF